MDQRFFGKASLVAASLGCILAFQNCSENVMSFTEASVSGKFGAIPCVSFEADASGNCLESKNGLLGNLYYLKSNLNSSGGLIDVTDKNGNSFALSSANVGNVGTLIDIGIRHESYVLMPQINVPTMRFTSGFRVDENNVLKDMDGQTLIEGFALDLKGYLKLPSGFAEGYYQLGTISDDGSVLEVSTAGNANFDLVVNNDHWHSPTLKCSEKAVYLSANSKLPIHLRYFQGPRTAIAMTMVMRKVASESDFVKDTTNCGFADGGTHSVIGAGARFFGAFEGGDSYVPDYANGVYGYMIRTGWSAIPKTAFALPDSLN